MKKYSFLEYMNSKGQVQKPVVDACADRTDPMTPPAAPKNGKPYGVKGGMKAKKGEKGFADEGDKKLKYTPKVEKLKCCKTVNIPTVEQIELAKLVSDSIKQDPTILETIVKQIRLDGSLGSLVGEILEQKETYKYISEVMSHKEYGPQVCNKLVRAMSEEVAPPYSDRLEDAEKPQDEDEALDNQDQVDGEGLDGDMEPGMDGMDPNMDGDMNGMDMTDGMEGGEDSEMNQDPMMGGEMPPEDAGMAPVDPMMGGEMPPEEMSPSMQHFQKAFQRAYQRAMMSKK
jgi:hypothetical protein